MGSTFSVEAIDGQAACGKTTFIEKYRENKGYQILKTDPGGEEDTRSQMYLVSQPTAPADCAQSGISSYFWSKVCALSWTSRRAHLLVDRSPLSHSLYEFLWRKLFPLVVLAIKDESSGLFHNFDMVVDAGWTYVRQAIRGCDKVKAALEHYDNYMLGLMNDLDNLAHDTHTPISIYICFNDWTNQSQLQHADRRRHERGGIDGFITETHSHKDSLYAPLECLLWARLWDVYCLRFKSPNGREGIFDIKKVQTDE